MATIAVDKSANKEMTASFDYRIHNNNTIPVKSKEYTTGSTAKSVRR